MTSSFILIYSLADSAEVNEMVKSLKTEESIEVPVPFSEIDESDFNDEYFERNCLSFIEDSDFLVFFASDNSRQSSLCLKSVKYARDLNKKTLVVRANSEFLSRIWIKKEWHFEDTVYNWQNGDERAEFTAILREWTGCKLFEGDRVGAFVSFCSNYSKVRLSVFRKEGSEWKQLFITDDDITAKCANQGNNDKLTSFSKPKMLDGGSGEYSSILNIRLAKGKYKYSYQSILYPKRVVIEDFFEVTNNSEHKSITTDMSQVIMNYISYVDEQEQKRLEFRGKTTATFLTMQSAYHLIKNHIEYLSNRKAKTIEVNIKTRWFVSFLVIGLLWIGAKFGFFSERFEELFELIRVSILFVLISTIFVRVLNWIYSKTFDTLIAFRLTYNRWKLDPAEKNYSYFLHLKDEVYRFNKFTPAYFESFDGYPDYYLNDLIKKFGKGKNVYGRNPINAVIYFPIRAIFLMIFSILLWIGFLSASFYFLHFVYIYVID